MLIGVRSDDDDAADDKRRRAGHNRRNREVRWRTIRVGRERASEC
jgi:hypothetical protein